MAATTARWKSKNVAVLVMQDADGPARSRRPLLALAIPPKSTGSPGEVDCDPNAVRVHHLVELLRGERAVDSSCTNGDLLCFALHMIMIDSGYQPNVSCLLTPSHTHPLTHSHLPSPPGRSLPHSLTHSPTFTFTYTLPDCPQSPPIAMTCSISNQIFSNMI